MAGGWDNILYRAGHAGPQNPAVGVARCVQGREQSFGPPTAFGIRPMGDENYRLLFCPQTGSSAHCLPYPFEALLPVDCKHCFSTGNADKSKGVRFALPEMNVLGRRATFNLDREPLGLASVNPNYDCAEEPLRV